MTDDNIIDFDGLTTLDIDPDAVLEGAKGKLKKVLIIGVEEESGDYYFAASGGTNAENLWDAEQFKMFLLGL